MSRGEIYKLDVEQGVAIGDVQGCRELLDKWIQVSGAGAGDGFTGSLAIEITIDGTHWVVAATVTNAAELVEIPQTAFALRVNTLVAISAGGPAEAWLSGHMRHTD